MGVGLSEHAEPTHKWSYTRHAEQQQQKQNIYPARLSGRHFAQLSLTGCTHTQTAASVTSLYRGESAAGRAGRSHLADKPDNTMQKERESGGGGAGEGWGGRVAWGGGGDREGFGKES